MAFSTTPDNVLFLRFVVLSPLLRLLSLLRICSGHLLNIRPLHGLADLHDHRGTPPHSPTDVGQDRHRSWSALGYRDRCVGRQYAAARSGAVLS